MIGHITKTKNKPWRKKFKYSANSGSAYHWSYVKRASKKEKRELIAKAMELAIKNGKYIKYSNKSAKSVELYEAIKPKFKIQDLKHKVHTNCCDLVSVCCRYAGFNTPKHNDSRYIADKWLGLKKIKYEKGMKLYRGDILISVNKPHTAIYLGKDK